MVKPAFLLDSNICIYILDDANSASAMRLQECDMGAALVSTISYAEILHGVQWKDDEEMAKFDRLFSVVPLVEFDQKAARRYCDIPFKRGTFDRLIAAHALSLDLTLVTNNESDFGDVPGLKVENWTVG